MGARGLRAGAGGAGGDGGPPDFPERLFQHLEERGLVRAGMAALDLGTGTGGLARALARRGLRVTAVDVRREPLAQAVESDRAAGVQVTHLVARAEDTALPAHTFDVVTAGRVWHGFDGAAAAGEAQRLLVDGGRLLLAHFDWLPLRGSVAAVTQSLMRQWYRGWEPGDDERRRAVWSPQLERGGFVEIESLSFDVVQTFGHEAWRGIARARARAGARLDGQLDGALERRFDDDLAEVLGRQFPEDVLEVPHRVFALWGRRPRRP